VIVPRVGRLLNTWPGGRTAQGSSVGGLEPGAPRQGRARTPPLLSAVAAGAARAHMHSCRSCWSGGEPAPGFEPGTARHLPTCVVTCAFFPAGLTVGVIVFGRSSWFRVPRVSDVAADPYDHADDPGVCPCSRPACHPSSLCSDHIGAVAFKVPIRPDGEVLPAAWWHWPHTHPCPSGDGWPIGGPPPTGGHEPAAWACPHRGHDPTCGVPQHTIARSA
jgi:hypothetical protein